MSVMRLFLVAALLFTASPALASPEDDYVACLIGRAAVELHGGTKNALDAQEEAYKVCPEPQMDEQEAEGLSDYVNLMVERMAGD